MLMNGLPTARPFQSGLSAQLQQLLRPTTSTSSSNNNEYPPAETPQHQPMARSRSQTDAEKRPPLSIQVDDLISRDDSSIIPPSSAAAAAAPSPKSSSSNSMMMRLQPPSLQPPATVSAARPTPQLAAPAPLSPKLDSSHIYASPTSVLPRRSRGLEFSRACTHLHHSTLAESSPDTSPVISSKGVNIPRRRGSHSSSTAAASAAAAADRSGMISGSVSSVNMLESDTTSSSEEEEDDQDLINPTTNAAGGDNNNMIITNNNTPQAANQFGNTAASASASASAPAVGSNSPFAAVNNSTWNPADWTTMGGYYYSQANLGSFQHARIGKYRSRHSLSSGSSASGGNSNTKPVVGSGLQQQQQQQQQRPLSPPLFRSIENPNNGGYFASSSFSSRATFSPPRRPENSNLHQNNDLRMSDVGDDASSRPSQPTAADGSASKPDGEAFGVVRRAVTRRSNLLVSC